MDALPLLGPYVPAAQGAQTSELVAATAALNLPAAHKRQLSLDMLLAVGLKEPGGQGAGAAAAAGQKEPAGHGLQAALESAPGLADQRPAAQAAHVPLEAAPSAAECVPAAHATQEAGALA